MRIPKRTMDAIALSLELEEFEQAMILRLE
jgi:hypothetical protein